MGLILKRLLIQFLISHLMSFAFALPGEKHRWGRAHVPAWHAEGCVDLVGAMRQHMETGRGSEEDWGSCLRSGDWTHLWSNCWQGRPLPRITTERAGPSQGWGEHCSPAGASRRADRTLACTTEPPTKSRGQGWQDTSQN